MKTVYYINIFRLREFAKSAIKVMYWVTILVLGGKLKIGTVFYRGI
jgi:hypothetical protein